MSFQPTCGGCYYFKIFKFVERGEHEGQCPFVARKLFTNTAACAQYNGFDPDKLEPEPKQPENCKYALLSDEGQLDKKYPFWQCDLSGKYFSSFDKPCWRCPDFKEKSKC